MIRPALVAALALSSAACASSTSTAATEPTSAATTSATTAATTAAAPSDDRLARADACANAAIAVDPKAPALEQMRTVVVGCMPVYSEKGCRSALEAAISDATPPDQRIVVMSKGCGEAYCPKFTDGDRPAFCSLPDTAPPTERAQKFGALRDRILLLELGEEGRARVDAAFEKAKTAQARAKEGG